MKMLTIGVQNSLVHRPCISKKKSPVIRVIEAAARFLSLGGESRNSWVVWQ